MAVIVEVFYLRSCCAYELVACRLHPLYFAGCAPSQRAHCAGRSGDFVLVVEGCLPLHMG